MRQPKGCRQRDNQLKIAVKLNEDTFMQIRKRAQAEKKRFSEVVEDVCKCGLLCLEENDYEEQLSYESQLDHVRH